VATIADKSIGNKTCRAEHLMPDQRAAESLTRWWFKNLSTEAAQNNIHRHDLYHGGFFVLGVLGMEKDIRTLCNNCRRDYWKAGYKTISVGAKYRELCDRCSYRMGWTYELIEPKSRYLRRE